MSAADLITTDGGLFTAHDMLGAYVIGMGIGALIGAICVAVLLARAVGHDIDRATTLPAPEPQPPLADDATTRITDAPVIDLPRRSGRTWSL